MNVWGKRTFSAAFPDDPVFRTVTVTDHVEAKEITPADGDQLVLNGNSAAVLVTADGPLALSVPTTSSLSNIVSSTVNVSNYVSAQLIKNTSGDVNLQAAHAIHLQTGSGNGSVVITGSDSSIPTHPGLVVFAPIETNEVANSAGALTIYSGGLLQQLGATGFNIHATSGDGVLQVDNGNLHLQASTGRVELTGRSLLLNLLPVPVQTYQNTLQATYSPAGAGLVSAIPDGSGPYFGFLSGWEQQAGWGWEYTWSGDIQALVGQPNQLEIQIQAGASGTTLLWSQFTNPIANITGGPFDCGYTAKVTFAIVTTGSGGTARVNLEYRASKGGGDGLPLVYTTLTSNVSYNSTTQQVFTVWFRHSEPTADLSVLYGKGIQFG